MRCTERKEDIYIKNKQVKWGILLSYLLILLNTLFGLVITPYMVGCLGEAEYGVYKTISSLTSSMMVLDLGLGGTATRYIAKFRATRQEKCISNFSAMLMMQGMILCGVVLLAAGGLYMLLEQLYAATFSSAQLQKAKMLFVVLTINVMFHIFENVVNGIITGYNRFVFGNGIKVLRLGIRIVLICVLLRRWSDSMAVVLIDLGVSMLFVLVELAYLCRGIQLKIRPTHWERALFIESGKYTLLMFLATVAVQVNSNLDNVLIGALKGPTFVSVYSFGLLIFSLFQQLSTAISGVMIPMVTECLEQKNGMEKVQEIVVRAGRIQFMLLGALAAGFLCIGRDFISVWLGAGYEDVYTITMILIIPALFELCINVCLSILRAKNMLGFRTATLAVSTVLNAMVTYLSVKHWSYIGAAIGTALSISLGSVIVMNLYYRRKLGLPILRIYLCIFDRTWLCLLISSVALCLYQQVFQAGFAALLGGILLFAVVYMVTMWFYGFNEEEKALFRFGGKHDD